jgi:CRP/FNR family transcriptional regulator
MEIFPILLQSDFLKGISEKNLKALESICLAKSVRKKESIFSEGQKGHSFFLLASGNIQLSKITPDGREIVIKIIKPGEIFAEVILFEENAYPVNALAIKDSSILMIPKHQFLCLLNDENFRNDFIAALMKKQRYLADQIYYLSTNDVEDRFFRFLKEQYGEKEEYTITLSKKDIASAIGTIPETFSRLILRLKKETKADWLGNTLKLKKGFWTEFNL